MDVAAWLRDLGLERYVSAFRNNDIGTEVLPKLTAEDLISIGVTSVGHWRKLLDAIATLSASEPARRAVRPKDCKARRPTRSTLVDRGIVTMLNGGRALGLLNPEIYSDG